MIDSYVFSTKRLLINIVRRNTTKRTMILWRKQFFFSARSTVRDVMTKIINFSNTIESECKVISWRFCSPEVFPPHIFFLLNVSSSRKRQRSCRLDVDQTTTTCFNPMHITIHSLYYFSAVNDLIYWRLNFFLFTFQVMMLEEVNRRKTSTIKLAYHCHW